MNKGERCGIIGVVCDCEDMWSCLDSACGVHQGSLLGPLLFMLKLMTHVKHCKIFCCPGEALQEIRRLITSEMSN